jgi:ADP-dependent phosphofructokinase/glucokinase
MARVDCGSCEIIISNYHSIIDVKKVIHYVENIMKDKQLSLFDKEKLFDDYCRNKTYTVSIDNQKLVKIHGMM